ncbi:MAG: C40 family peptidase [Bacteroidales bacterium]|nr:C40 family peptidase [Bacteroidales bacterium]
MKPLRMLFAAILLGAAALGAAAQETAAAKQEDPRKVADAIIKEAGRHLGKPYLYGGNGPQSFDCTGFTCYVFRKFGYELSRTSSDQAQDGREIKGTIDKYQKGDIIIFGGRTAKRTPGHVGIFIAADSLNKSFTFIHASSSGVTISHIDEPYYAQRFLGVRRILPDFPAGEKERKGRFNLSELLNGKTGAARDSVLNAVQERRLVLFPDGSWAFLGADGQYVEADGSRDFILNADGTWRTEEATTAEFYTVRAGDTFQKIARKFGISVDSLLEMNGLNKRSTLRLGDRLRVR